MQKSLAFLYTNNERLVREIKETVPFIIASQESNMENCLVVQWLGIHASTAEGAGLITGQGIKILQAVWCGQKNKQKE